jgi:nitronate monooxygenase
MLGAQGALMGTRFYASAESLGRDSAKQRIVDADGGRTARTRVFDIVRDYAWPPGYTGRALRNDFMERWNGREDELALALDTERAAFRAAAGEGDYDTAMVWAGEAVDLIRSVDGAASLVARISADAEACIRLGERLLR